MARRVALHWSGGKDSAMALEVLRRDPGIEVDRLVTTVGPDGAATVHEVPEALLRAQADSLGVRLDVVRLSGDGLDGYQAAMGTLIERLRADGVDAVAFGDLHVSGAREHRRRLFEPALQVLEPLWERDGAENARAFVALGLCAVTVVVDAAVLGRDRVGVALDAAFLDGLPAGADPSGELGEYHSFVHDGPGFGAPVAFALEPSRRLVRTIGTHDGPREFEYWVATPRLP